MLTNHTRNKIQRAAESTWDEKQERWRWCELKGEREVGMIQTDRRWEHLLQPLPTSALLCLPETRVNRPTFCLCSSSSTIVRAASLQSLQLPCRQFVFLPTQGFFFYNIFFAKSTFLKQIQLQLAICCIPGVKFTIYNISKLFTY